MALGGGTFLVQNKVLPGAYINFVSKARASATLSDRGYGALTLDLDWGIDGEVFTVETADFQKDSLSIFGYDYSHDKLKGLRDFFKNAKTGYFYRLNSGGVKATNSIATAKYFGVRGNDITISVLANVDDPEKFDVHTYLDGVEVDAQRGIASRAELTNNDYVEFKDSITLSVLLGEKMTGGTNGTTISGINHQAALDKLEAYTFNTLGCLSNESTIKDLYIAFTKRMRDEVGAKFQTVVYKANETTDYEGIISLDNPTKEDEVGFVYWVTGASAGCLVNRSNTNKTYDGEFTPIVDYKQRDLTQGIQKGKFMFHKVGDTIRVLKDINTFVSFTTYKNRDFSLNQVLRVLDQIGNDCASIFNTTYLGKVQNNNAGRIAFWNDLVHYSNQLQNIEAIQEFEAEDITVTQGEGKEDVYVEYNVNPVVAMEKLYMKVVVI